MGNDFVVVNALQNNWRPKKDFLRRCSDRNTGIGFDQWLMVAPSSQAGTDFDYLIYNANGSQSGQCLNGSRCMLHFLHHHDLSSQHSVVLKTTDSSIRVTKHPSGIYSSAIDPPSYDPNDVGFTSDRKSNPHRIVTADGIDVEIYALFIGNPHAVLMVEDLQDSKNLTYVTSLQKAGAFVNGINIELVELSKTNHIKARVFERGVGETKASGSCAAASAIASMLHLNCFDTTTVHMSGGRLDVHMNAHDAPVRIDGTSHHVFDGYIDCDDGTH